MRHRRHERGTRESVNQKTAQQHTYSLAVSSIALPPLPPTPTTFSSTLNHKNEFVDGHPLCVCVCVCARARVRACACVVYDHLQWITGST